MIKKHNARREWVIFAIILSVSAVLAFGYYVQVGRPNLAKRTQLHSEILDGTTQSPYRYQVLVPFLAENFIKAFSLFLPHFKAFLLSYALYDLAAIFAFLSILYIFFKHWFAKDHALIGILFVAGTMAVALRNHCFEPWSLLEAVLFSLGLLLIYRKQHWVLGMVILLASLNRETAVFIPLAFLFIRIDMIGVLKGKGQVEKKTALLFLIYVLLWFIPFAGLRCVIGTAHHIHTVKELWAYNIEPASLFRTVVRNGLFLGFFWIFAVLGFRHAPRFIQNAALIIPIHLLLVIVYGVWYEVRLLMPLYAILIPLGLSYVFPRTDSEKPISPESH